MITLASMTTEVFRRLGAKFLPLHGQNPVIDALNAAQLMLLNTLPVFHLKNAIKTAKFDLVENTGAYQHPSDLIRIYQIWLDYSAAITESNAGAEATAYDEMNFIRPFWEVGSSRYPFYDPHVENGFAISPVPSADMSNGGRIRYVYKLPAISRTQPSLLADNLRNLLVFRAVAQCAGIEGYDAALAKQYEQLFENELAAFMPKEE